MENKYDVKREIIKSNAKIIFGSLGYEKTTMDDIASKTGLRKNTLYYYFRSKEDLFGEVMKEKVEEMTSAILRSVNKAGSYEEKVKSFMKSFLHSLHEATKIYAVSAKTLLEFIFVMEKTDNKQIQNFPSILAGILKEGIKKKEFIKHDCEELAIILLELAVSYRFTQMSKSVFNFFTIPEFNKPGSNDMILERGIDYVLSGIRNK